jgi:quinoprotein glucose dehydrogenase
VKFFAAQGLARVPSNGAIPGLVALARDAADGDPYLRHAAARALAACADRKALAGAAKNAPTAVRRAVVLALRHQKSADVASFLDDSDAGIVLEAARAINDVPLEGGFAKLAGLIDRRGLADALAFRVLNANYRLGQAEHARAVAGFAARTDVGEALRVEAVTLLRTWAKPSGRDRILGVWRPLKERDASLAAEALRPVIRGLIGGPDKLRQQAVRAAGELGLKEVRAPLHALLRDGKRSAATRLEVLRALEALKDGKLDDAVDQALASAEPALRAEARRVLAVRKPAEALASLEKAIAGGTTLEKQRAYDVLGAMKGAKAAALVGKSLDALLAGKVVAEARLELIEAAEKHARAPGVKEKLGKYAKQGEKADLGRWRESLTGGDAEAGKRLFLHKAELSCLRCHKADGQGAGEVGPDLTGIGSKQTRDYLLESIVSPSKQIAKGYETVELVLANGQMKSGILRGETAKEVKLITAEGAIVTVKADQIEERKSGKSAMPEDVIKHLSRREMRDLVEYLASLKEKKKD